MTVTNRRSVLRAVWVILSLPLLLAFIEAESFHLANRENGAMVSSGEKRGYLLYVPPTYDRSKPTPLVISLHAAALWGAAQKETSQWNTVADREGFIVVYPSGFDGDGPRIWRADGARVAKDVRFISELIDTLEAAYNIDTSRIYANGLSNGGGMSFVLSCTLSDRIAAVGMVGAAHLLPWKWCTDRRPVPMISFHGTADLAVPYNGGVSWVAPDRFPSIPGFTANWAKRNRCESSAVDSAVAAHVTRREYLNCAGDAAVVLYTIKGGGHTWPGGKPLPEWFVGSTTNEIDATRLMWEFFSKHPLKRN
jgi:polyhydroxybutyrate depolymerase